MNLTSFPKRKLEILHKSLRIETNSVTLYFNFSTFDSVLDVL